MDELKNTYEVHRLPSIQMQEIHKSYGLWIIGGNTGGRSYPDFYNLCPERYFEYYSLSHMFDGYGRVWIKDKLECDVKPGSCVLITPRTVNRYGGYAGQCYIEDSITFKGPLADMLMRSGIISDAVVEVGTLRRLLPIINLSRDPARDAQIKANMELQNFLVELYLERKAPGTEYPLFENLITAVKRDPGKWWNVTEMAEMCNLSDDQLRRVFVKYTGESPKNYVDRLKAGRACELLTTSAMRVSEIGTMLGYIDQYHFSRRFKKLVGVSPYQYRAAMRNKGLNIGSPLEKK